MFDVTKRINDLCKKKNIGSTYELAKLTGITQSTLQNILSEGRSPRTDTIERICNGLGITLAEFFTENEQQSFVYEVINHANTMTLNEDQKAALEMYKNMASGEQQKRLFSVVNKLKNLPDKDQEALLQIISSLATRR